MTKEKYYQDPDQNFNFAKMEKEISSFWQENKIFEQSIDNNDSSESSDFVFYDGPPFANGLPHYGHLLTGFIKDSFARFQTMKGRKVERKFGWDTHGLPVEMQTEKELGVSGQIAIKEYGIEKFNEACKTSVMKYADEWKDYVHKQGRWVDFEGGYKTMDLNYMESVIWAFKQLYDKGLLYEDYRVMPYSWKCETPVSNFETKMDNAYRKKTSKSATILFELDLDTENNSPQAGVKAIFDCFDKDSVVRNYKLKLAVWTTTPWTLPSNLALAIGKDIDYDIIKHDDEFIIISSNLKEKYKEFDDSTKISTIKGFDLVGLKYKPLFEYFTNDQKIKNSKNSFTILNADFVTTEDGTGIVHIAPAFGEDDQILCKKYDIPVICPVDQAGKFTGLTYDIENLSIKNKQVFECNDDIIKYLKSTNNWLKTEQYIHNYPHCWRTDTPLIYKAVSSWYVKVTDIKDKMIEANKQINWIPEHIKEGQFGKWLEGARDWSITRNRFWGCPVPVWKSKSGKIKVFGSVAEIEKASGKKVDNLHRPFIDEITFEEDGEVYTRVSDVLDCWFESGSMPFAQKHYPFENKDWFEKNFPADFITEYIAQTRGWFYTLTVMSVALFDRAPFKNVICHGTILDEKSEKLSKRLQNYPDPIEIFDKIGSDAMRFYLLSTAVMKGQELKMSKDGKEIIETSRVSIKPLLNSYNFFCLYANSDGIRATRIDDTYQITNVMDSYILSKLKGCCSKIENSLDNYDSVTACSEFNKFFEVLNNWYIRRSRERFWKKEVDQDKKDAYNVLCTIILTICEISAPLLPFTTEKIWQGLSLKKA
ncbi:MAG: isoleucyl-tRNA synthetase [Rickettsiales bacterium]|jgi:isoleucyl-tRNA synthetase